MPAKAKVQYECQACGGTVAKWSGQCPHCNAWNTLTEVAVIKETVGRRNSAELRGLAGDTPMLRTLGEIELDEQPRISTGINELNRVLGGGLVAGSVVLIGGDPGIGKSTLVLQALAAIAELGTISTLYVTGEESQQQIGMRAQRLGVAPEGLQLLTETNTQQILQIAAREKPRVVVIDSVQTVYCDEYTSAPGSVTQVRESTALLVRYAKMTATAVFLIGHVTKDGALAGPRILEHMVDTVLYFEGEAHNRIRMLRAIKNRFGAVNELGVFAMGDKGLKEVSNPSAIFLSREVSDVPGSVVMVTREGTRPLLVEVQALVDGASAANPRRVAVGLEQNRLVMLLAVLHRHADIVTFDQDVFVNVVGGVKITETAADLAIVLAVLSSLRGRPLPSDLVVFGELGLAGELRPVPSGLERLREAAKHGFKRAIVPRANAPKNREGDLETVGVATVAEAVAALEG
jgi:DNA repair protein RadA/Sms